MVREETTDIQEHCSSLDRLFKADKVKETLIGGFPGGLPEFTLSFENERRKLTEGYSNEKVF